MSLQAAWKDAKKDFTTKGLKHIRQSVLEEMDALGWADGDFGKQLGNVDKAKKLDDRRAAWAKSQKTLTRYHTTLKTVTKGGRDLDPRGKTALKKLLADLENLRAQGEALCQDPEPSRRATDLKVVSKMNLAGGLKPKHLDVGKLTVTAWISMDEELLRLESAGELGFHWSEMQREVTKVLEDASSRFHATILDLDAKLETKPEYLLDDGTREKKVREAAEVMQHYARVVERRINEVVDGYWKKATQRRQYLSDFKFQVGVDIVMGTLALGVSTASLVASFGTAAMNWFVIAKTVADMALAVDKLTRKADEVKRKLEPKMEDIEDLWKRRKREAARGETDVADQAAQVGREALAQVLGPISAELFTTASRTLKMAQEYAGKLTKVEEQAGKMYRKIDEMTAAFSKIPDPPSADLRDALGGIHTQFVKAANEYQRFADELRDEVAWAHLQIDICENVREEDWMPKWTATTGTLGKTALGIYAAVQLGLRLGGVHIPILT